MTMNKKFMHKKLEKCLGINRGANKKQQRDPT